MKSSTILTVGFVSLLLLLLFNNGAGAGDNASFVGISWNDDPNTVETKLKSAGIFVPIPEKNEKEIDRRLGTPILSNMLLDLHLHARGDAFGIHPTPLKDLPLFGDCPSVIKEEHRVLGTSGLTKAITLIYSGTEPKKLLWYSVYFDSQHYREIKDSFLSKYGDPKYGDPRDPKRTTSGTLWKVGSDYILLRENSGYYVNANEVTSYCSTLRAKKKELDNKVKKQADKLF